MTRIPDETADGRTGATETPKVARPKPLSKPRRVPVDAPFAWLAAGWRDIWSAPMLSLGYGAVFAMIAGVLAAGSFALGLQALFLPLAGGFLIVGPFVAVGLYEISRRRELGEAVSFRDVARAGLGARGQLLFFGALLMIAVMIWLRTATLLMALFLGTTSVPPIAEFMQLLLFTPAGLSLLIVGSLVGGAIAVLVYASSAVAIPMLQASETDVVTAAAASFAAVIANPGAMALWAVLIAVIIAAGFATLLVGLVIAFPLIGHASWHAYRSLYEA